jgi:NAD(P)-dependent dehydrogenase (short-subunit alcohol dehydrogenase family)
LVEKYGASVLPIKLDVTDRAADFAAAAQAHAHFGRLGVVVNNAGFGVFGFVEEVGEEDVRAQIETNVFGALWVNQAAVPLGLVKADYESRLKNWEEWQPVAVEAQGRSRDPNTVWPSPHHLLWPSS